MSPKQWWYDAVGDAKDEVVDIKCWDDFDDDASDWEVVAKYFGSSPDCMMLNNPIDKCLTISPPSVIMQCIIYI